MNGKTMSFDQLAQARGFKKESYRPLEKDIYDAIKYNYGNNEIKRRTLKIWHIYQSHFPELNTCDDVCLYLQQQSLVPELRDVSFDQIPLAMGYPGCDSLIMLTP